MALFGGNEGNSKQENLMAKYGLENIDPQYVDAVQKIARDLAGSGLTQFGGMLANDQKATARANAQFSKAIVEQNWIIIRQLDGISYMLEQIVKK